MAIGTAGEKLVAIEADAGPAVLILDPGLARRFIAWRTRRGEAGRDEVWDGVYVVAPLANNDHQTLGFQLALAFNAVVEQARGIVFHGVNVSDRARGWRKNYRIPDVAVFLRDGPGRSCGTHWVGGPDLAVEVLSPRDPARQKRSFYAKNGTRELLVVDREPWAIELYRLAGGELALVGSSRLDAPATLASEVLPLGFRLVAGDDRPRVEVAATDDGRTWLA